ncbi:MAG TPA: ribonucleotide-diphosphate reductase subunit beta [Solirubrobacterales bacterium]|nr:ribonucleotide-diphosphate reductase subunit beta [Solirubrobacterales bacterium]
MAINTDTDQVVISSEDDALQILLDADIDKVMAGLDRIVEAAPSYKKLFSRWENQHWNSEQFDFTIDAEQWATPDSFNDAEREYLQWGLASFFLGEERVTTELLPFAIAVPSHEARAFLCTQISDEARHMVFFDRFYREVFGSDAATLTRNLEIQRPNMNAEWGELFDGILHDCAEALRKDPSDMTALVRGITVYMIVIEGTLALSGARFIIRSLKEKDLLPGFRQGFTAVNRDESRHVGFGVKFLADAIKEDPAHKETIQAALEETLPVATLALAPPMAENPYDFVTPFGFDSRELYGYAMRSLSKKLAAMGMAPEGFAAAAAS